MRRHSVILAAVLFSAAPFLTAQAAEATAPVANNAPTATKSFSDAEKAAIGDIIKEYLTKDHPEVLVAAMEELQKREQASAQTKSEAAIKEYGAKLFNDPTTPVGGNPKGDVAIVEFFDYQCGYCKIAEPVIEKLLKEDQKVKFIYKDFPILGAVSTEAGKASLAAAKQGTDKYIKFHNALMGYKDHLSSDIILKTAKDVGLNTDKLKKDMDSDEIASQIKANIELGGQIGVRGTPLFIVGDQVFPGAIQYDQLKDAVAKARSGSGDKK